jgi:hypothetical protein
MNRKNRTTLESVFVHPTKTNIKWSDIEALLLSLGAKIREGSGSRIKVSLGIVTMVAHWPHPGNEAKAYQVEIARDFLQKSGVTL